MPSISNDTHWLVSKLLIVAPPLLNALLLPTGVQLTVSENAADKITSLIVMAIGLVYSKWTLNKAKASSGVPPVIQLRPKP